MKREELLDTAKQYVTKDRAADHGEAERTFLKISHLWTAYLGEVVSAEDVANMMILLKVARAKGNPRHEDNWVDIAGYAACGGELATHDSESSRYVSTATTTGGTWGTDNHV